MRCSRPPTPTKDHQHPPHRGDRGRCRRCCRPAYVVSALAALALFFYFGYNPWVSKALRARLRSVAPHADLADLRGAFPFHFSTPLLSVPGLEVQGLEVDYTGTLNPFRVTSQVGEVGRARAHNVVVGLLGHRFEAPLDELVVSRLDDGGGGWQVAVRLVVAGRAIAARVTLAPLSLEVDIDDGAFGLRATPTRVAVAVAGRDYVVVSRDGGGNFLVEAPTVATLRGRWHAGDAAVAAEDLVLALLDNPPRDLGRVEVGWGPRDGDVRVACALFDLAWRAPVLNGTVGGAPFTADVPARGRLVVRPPLLPTPLGRLRGVDVAEAAGGAANVTVRVGHIPVVAWFADGHAHLAHGPVTARGSEDGAEIVIAGGRYREFSCIHVRGVFATARPHEVALRDVSLHGAHGERFTGHGVFLLADRKLKLNMDLEIDT
jgi:hypothetical protein